MFINILVVCVCGALFYFKVVDVSKIGLPKTGNAEPIYALAGKSGPSGADNKYYNYNW
jgi:hypothetical protein